MKNFLLSVFLVIIAFNTHLSAQKIDIKKDKILIDKTPVAIITSEKDVYTISSLDGVAKLILTSKSNTGNSYKMVDKDKEYTTLDWFEVKKPDNDKVVEIEDKSLGKGIFPSTGKKNVAENLILGDNKLINANGIDENLIIQLFSTKGMDISSMIDQTANDIVNQAVKEKKIIEDNKIAIDGKGNIFLDNNQIGTVIYSNKTTDNVKRAYYIFYDIDKKEIGRLNDTYKFEKNTIVYLKTFDQKSIPLLYMPSGVAINKDLNAINGTIRLFANGYTFGHFVTQAQEAAYNNAVNNAKSTSKNIYNQKGYVIDEKGNKIDGIISIEFESIDNKVNPNSGIADMTSYGKTVGIKFTNDQGKEKTNYYKSKKGIRFYVNNNGTDEAYIGIVPTGDALNTIGNLMNLSLDQSSFFQIVYEKNDNMVLLDPMAGATYYIKFAGKEKALLLSKDPEKNVDKLKKYTQCEKISYQNYNSTSLDDLKKVIDEYISNCK